MKLNEKASPPSVDFVDRVLDSVKNKLIGKDLGNLEIENILNNAFRPFDVKFENGFDSGKQNTDDKIRTQLIQAYINSDTSIVIEYYDGLYDVFDTDEYWNLFKKVVKSFLSHELTHRDQFVKIFHNNRHNYDNILNKIHGDPNNLVGYLSNVTEISAFANEAVTEFMEIGYKKADILNRLKKPYDNNIYPDRAESDIFWMYTEWFEAGDKVLQKFLDSMYSILSKINEHNIIVKMPYLKDLYESIDYKHVEFGMSSDRMFDYYYPDLRELGINNPTKEQMDNTYIATNNKRHLHINIDTSLQKQGLASEIIKAFVYLYGYRIIPKGRITNPDMIKVLDKVKQDNKFVVNDEGDHYEIDEK